MTFDPVASDARHRTARPGVAKDVRMRLKGESGVPPPIRVLLASSCRDLLDLLCQSLAHDRRFEVVAKVADGNGVVACPVAFDVSVIDLAISGPGIVPVMGHLRSSAPLAPVVVVASTDAIYLRHALEAEGAVDFLVMPKDLKQLNGRVFRCAQTSSAELAPT